jgi:hypothetical protein
MNEPPLDSERHTPHLTPIDQIESYTTLTDMFDEVKKMSESEVCDPEALTRRCAEIAGDVPRLVNMTLSRIRVAGVVVLKELEVAGRIPPGFPLELEPRLRAVWASDVELRYLSSVGVSSYGAKVLLSIARYTFLTVAFIVSFVFAEIVGAATPGASSNFVTRLITGTFAFILQLSMLGRAGQSIETFIRLWLLNRIRRKLLLAIRTLAGVCLRVWNEMNDLMPVA